MKHLSIAALAIAAIGGAVIFVVEYNKIGGLVVDRAQRSTTFFNAQIEHLLDQPGLLNASEYQAALERVVSQSRKPEVGRFVSVVVNDIGSLELARLNDNEYEHARAVKKFINASQRRASLYDPNQYQSVTLDGTAHFYVVLPLRKSSGEIAAYISGVFVLSEQAYSQIYRQIITAVGLVVAMIIITTLALYLIISRLLAKMTKLSERLLEANLDIIEVLGGAIAKRDSDTDVHNYRVAIYAVRTAEALGIDRRSIRSLIKGAFLHDVGKIGITDSILLKPDRLTEQEFEVVKQHVQHGLDIGGDSEWLSGAATVVGYHHEKFDGSGYGHSIVGNSIAGDAIGGEDIPLNARIFAIADVFDALTSKRPYRNAFNYDKAMQILQESSGTHFDPAALYAFDSISEQLHTEYANREDENPRRDLAAIVDEYFKNEAEWLEGL